MSSKKNAKNAKKPARYEYRVWGEWARASRQLAKMADTEREERIDDCYLLVGDPSCNAKIRRSRLKVKRLVEVNAGFQRWNSSWHGRAATSPAPFDKIMSEISGGGAPTNREERQLLRTTMNRLDLADTVQPVFVTKRRQRYHFESIRAETCDIEIRGQKGYLSTLAIEGPNLRQLVRLRTALGLEHVPNLPLHVAVGQQKLGWC